MKMISLISILLVIAFCSGELKSQQNISGNWTTKFEKSNYLETESYDETINYFRRLAKASEYAKLFSFGISPQGRDLYCLAVSKDQIFTPGEAKKIDKPILLIINGIHSGEIEGKDACMLLLREMLVTKEKENLLNSVTLLVVPIFNVDGHERSSPYNRINQNGPKEMGWRTTSQNLNLNRDWMKADAPEMQAMLKLFSALLPDFVIDTHTTDGADYQYTITYDMEKFRNIYTGTAEWTKNNFIPNLEKSVEDAGFLARGYVSLKNWSAGLDSGIVDWAATPRFSNGYAAVQNRPCLLIETHMLKPYKERVFATKAMLESVIKYLNEHPVELLNLNEEADSNSINEFHSEQKYLPVSFFATDKYKDTPFKRIQYRKDSSWVSGVKRITYTGKKQDINIPFYYDIRAKDSVNLPVAYLIPKEWGDWENIIERIKLHGIKVEELQEDNLMEVIRYKFKNIKFAAFPFEGRQRVDCDYDTLHQTLMIPRGTYVINTNQRTIRVIANLLEPKSEDSFLRWGFFNSIFERKEYFENYVMEKMALEMMKSDPKLKEEFEKKLSGDKNFKNNPYARLNFFYEHSPYFDKGLNLYPIMRVE